VPNSDLEREETACAIQLDRDEGKFQVRKLEREPRASFWLPRPADRFYPDFVAKLREDRIRVLEYRGVVFTCRTTARMRSARSVR